MQKVLVRIWLSLGEEIKENLCKQTQLVKYEYKHRLEMMANQCSAQLRDMQEQSARRHGRLMQKVPIIILTTITDQRPNSLNLQVLVFQSFLLAIPPATSKNEK